MTSSMNCSRNDVVLLPTPFTDLTLPETVPHSLSWKRFGQLVRVASWGSSDVGGALPRRRYVLLARAVTAPGFNTRWGGLRKCLLVKV